ncbi:MAG: MBL fold metallo-hydrolase [Oscillospiraceae bacterium]|nr:MBL fold metallo-hydrolase [Oscillospiraceae bacterium]
MQGTVMQVGCLDTNCAILTGNGKDAVVVDPGDGAKAILAYLNRQGLDCRAILLTHGHDDHTGAVEEIRRETGAEVWISQADAYRLKFEADHFVKDGDILDLAGMEFRVVSVPGHTEGSVLYLTGDLMLAGDTLFHRSIGRTDLPGGNWNEMQKSLERIKTMGDRDYQVLPGHGSTTTLQNELRRNPFLQ